MHRPAEFYVSLLNAQPVEFYSSVTLVQDARRHELIVRQVCVLRSGYGAKVESESSFRVGLRALIGLRAQAFSLVDFPVRVELVAYRQGCSAGYFMTDNRALLALDDVEVIYAAVPRQRGQCHAPLYCVDRRLF